MSLTKAEKQRARRASPEAKAREARASRRSYWKKKEGVGNKNEDHEPETCDICSMFDKRHNLGLLDRVS